MSESDELIRNWERNNDTLEKLKSVAVGIKSAEQVLNNLKQQRLNLIKTGRSTGLPMVSMAVVLEISRARLYQLLDSEEE
tara:strand:+ start:219 stop:458 length:240 start_codon:yes stop_codon:yes gene_type:complete